MTDDRFDVSDAPNDFASLAEITFMAGGRYGIEARPWKRPELFGAGYVGLDLFGLEAGIEAWWSVVNRTPTGWDRTLDGAPVGVRTDDPRWFHGIHGRNSEDGGPSCYGGPGQIEDCPAYQSGVNR